MKFYQTLLPYAVAIGSTALALVLTLRLESLIQPTISSFFFLAVTVTTWYGGMKPGIVSIVLSTLAINYFFTAPIGHFFPLSPSPAIRLGIFFIVASIINLLAENLRNSKRQIEQLNQKLLQENAEQLQMALAGAQMGMWQWNLVTGEINWSPEHAYLFGLEPGTFDGTYETFDSFVHPDDRQALNQALQQAIQTHTIYQHEFRIVWRDGSIHWVEGRGNCFYNPAGEALIFTGTIMNIDERKKAEFFREKQLQQQRLVMEITQQIRESLNLEDILQSTVEGVRRFLETDRALVFKIAPDYSGNILVESVTPGWMAISSLQTYDPCVGAEYIEPFKQGLVTAKSDIYNAEISPCHLEMLAGFQVRANLVVPILNKQELWGLLVVHHCAGPRKWQPAEIELMRQLASQVGIAIQQSAMFEQLQTELQERLEAEAALRESEEIFRQFAENIQEVFFLQSVDLSQMIYINPAYEIIWQRSCQSLYDNPLSFIDSIHPEDINRISRAMQSLLNREADFREEYRIIRADGSICWIYGRTFFVYNQEKEIYRVAGLAIDITKSKLSKLAIKEKQETLKTFFQNVPAGVAMFDRNMNYLMASNRWVEDYNLESVESIIGRSHYEIFPEITTAWKQVHQRSLSGKIERCEEDYFQRQDGSSQWVRWEVLPWYQANQEIGGIIIFSEDISERKQAEIALQNLNTELEQRVTERTAELTILNDRLLVALQEQQQAEEFLRQQARQEQLLRCITQAISQSLDLNTILNTVVTEVRQILQVDRAAVYRFNPDWSGDFVVESVGENWVKLVKPDIKTAWEDTYLQETQGGRFRNHETFVVPDIYTFGLQSCHIEILEQFQAKAYAISPIFAGDCLWGLLAIYQNSTSRNWQSWEIELLQQITSQLAIAIQQSQLYRQLEIELQERKQTLATLREAERRWRFLLDNVQLLVVGLDHQGTVNYINSFFLQLTGYSESEVLGENWFTTFLPSSQRRQLQTAFSEIMLSNAHPYYQNVILTKSGEQRFIAWNNTQLKDYDGHVIGTISIGEDITERLKIEQIKNEFIGLVSHELRTPLTAIRAALGLLNTGVYDKKPDKFKRMIDIALTDSERLVRLVNDILDLERLESGHTVLEKTKCKAFDLLSSAVEGMRAIANQQQISLVILPTDAEVCAAADSIIQTLTNLLSNAIKFSPANSTITVSAQPQGNYLRFQVQDHGRGIPADKLEVIFGRFQQVDASDSRQKGGTGLGLAICRSIIEQHGGKIWAESVLGAGSTFFFTLPIPQEEMI